MSTPLFANNAAGTLASSVTNVAGTLNLTAGHGARFPSPVTGEYFVITVQTGSSFEIMHCTGRSGDALTVTRARESTSARSFPAGASVTMRVTAGLFATLMAALLPIHVALPCFGATPPPGWLQCAGQAVSRNAYPQLFAALGITHGAGDGVSTFNLPDMRGRVPAGTDNMGGSAAGRLTPATSVGWTGGVETQALAEANLPVHTHPLTGDGAHDHTGTVNGAGSHTHTGTTQAGDGAHTHTGTTDVDGSHDHDFAGVGAGSLIANGGSYGNTTTQSTSAEGLHTHPFTASGGAHVHDVEIPNSGDHTHTLVVHSGGGHAHTIGNTGGGTAHNNVQPTMGVLWILRGA